MAITPPQQDNGTGIRSWNPKVRGDSSPSMGSTMFAKTVTQPELLKLVKALPGDHAGLENGPVLYH